MEKVEAARASLSCMGQAEWLELDCNHSELKVVILLHCHHSPLKVFSHHWFTQGYACEEHLVTTVDGYVLSVPRIPVGLSQEPWGNRPPVLLQQDGITWLLIMKIGDFFFPPNSICTNLGSLNSV
ncbi:uncharacterized protein LOC110277980 [Arachis duranensis]|uniref:Uncharacterized protein LOC110277980 n=1 Tax=Arachis duranensis TaxID=130453 RepID=A0A9C6TP03_ARADU|nr:uncharacterized protein LOC110277980 [Arachis duranensis]